MGIFYSPPYDQFVKFVGTVIYVGQACRKVILPPYKINAPCPPTMGAIYNTCPSTLSVLTSFPVPCLTVTVLSSIYLSLCQRYLLTYIVYDIYPNLNQLYG